MKRKIMVLGAVLAWVCGVFGATHEGVQLWENGPLWAKTNIGANSPTEAGYYFWWGDTLGYKWQNSKWVASDGSVSGFSFEPADIPTNGKSLAQLQSMGVVNADGNLQPAYDAAARQWGDDWRMPKVSELNNLRDLCSWNWTTNNGVVGYTVTGKGLYSGNSVFFPAVGWGIGATINDLSVYGCYRSSTIGKSTSMADRLYFNLTRYGVDEFYVSWGYPIRPVKSLIASKKSATAALDTRTGTRTVAAKESIAYDAAWGEATSGTLTVNGTVVSGLSKKGTYAWTPNTSQTNYWKLAYKAGTANYAATFQSSTYTVKYNANGGSGSMASVTGTYGQSAKLTTNAFSRPGYAFLGWTTTPNGTTIAYKDGQSMNIPFSQSSGTLNLYAKWTDTWYVNAATGNDANEGASAADPFKTIQRAIDLTVPGMTIVVADGTYAPINSGNKSITIRSVNGAAKTVIDGGYPAATNRCVFAGGNDGQTNTVIRGFTIQNGCTIGFSSEKNGAGVAGGTLHNCIVRANHGGLAGGGVAHSLMFECEISDNETENGGGGAYKAYLNNCQLLSNRCKNDGAGAFGGILNNCTIVSNRSELAGGGTCDAVQTNCVVRENVAMSHGGGAYGGSLYGCTITNNIAYQNGGGVRGSKVENCDISGNEAYIVGGGAYAAICYGSKIRGNKATSNGGGVCESQVINCELSDNEAGQHGGGACRGELQNCIIRGNRAREGNGGGVVNASSRNCTIYGNACAYYGGGTCGWPIDGVPGGTNFNCIVYANAGARDMDIDPRVPSFNCCTDDPHFIRAEAGDFRLRCDSPCIDAGDKTYVTNTVDFAGNLRIVNNKVDIGAYEFSAALDRHFTVEVTNGTGGAIYYEGDMVTIEAEDRSSRYSFVRWTGDVSVLKNVNSRANTFTMPTRNLVFTAEYDDLQQYLVIDLSGGKDATSYPVSYLTDVPAGGWTDTYKTTKLVMRRIDPGTFTMGSPEGEVGRQSGEAQHQVTLTHPYYIGVFELTQRQWELVMGTRPSAFSNTVCYATRPVECVSFNDIRGADLGQWWPQMNTVDESSFMGRLRAKTGRLFDLPTEAQWEYACRAGTTTALNSGKNLVAASGVDANMAEVGRYYYNSGAYNSSYDFSSADDKGSAKVGSYLPNAWGLYDMHGNIGEFCLDWYRLDNTSELSDPVGPETGTSRNVRCGTWGNYAYWCRSAARSLFPPPPSRVSDGVGLRPVINFADFSLKQVVNVQASDGTVPEGIRVTWTAVPGTEKYRIFKSLTSNIDDATVVGESTTAEYLSVQPTTDKYWFWVQAKVDGIWGTVSESDTGYRVRYQLTVKEGTGTTNCFANTWVPITANAAPTGYSFKEWTCAAADVALVTSKTSASTTFKMPGRAVTLTATYKANGYTVKFNANKGAGTMSNESFTYDVAKSLSANAFTRTGYTYQGWATTAAGGKVYSDKQTVSNLTAAANGTVNLYAVWKANAYAVKFNANGGSGTMANLAMTYDTAKALTANAFTRTGYTFQGWATSASGAVAHADKVSVKNLTAAANGTVSLYAVWTANPYTVTFDANGGDGAAMGAQDFAYGTAQNLPAVGYARTGYTFLGWSTNPKATAATYADGASVSDLATSGTLKLYAVWQANAYTIRFESNGAEGEMEDLAMTYDESATLPENGFVWVGYLFRGWGVEETAQPESELYQPGDVVSNLTEVADSVVALYAIWEKEYVANPEITPASGSVFATSQTITMTCASEGATIHYTTDGSEPTVESPVYRRFRISGKTTIKARAYLEDGASSDMVTAEYALGQCPDPVIASAGGTTFQHSGNEVSIGYDCEEGVVRYTTDGSEPTSESPVYEGAFTIDETTVVKAKAFSDNYFDSAVVTAELTREWLTVETPVIDAPETFTGSKTMVKITCATEGAIIRYTINGSEPNSHSPRYTGPFAVEATTTVKAYATLADSVSSAVATKVVTKVWGIGDSLGAPDQEFTTSGAAGWVDDGGVAMKSGAIADNQRSILSTVVSGKGTLSFEWKTSCEQDELYHEWDHLEFQVDGTVVKVLDGITTWTAVVDVPIEDEGDHTLAWVYVKDDMESEGDDSAWLRKFVWTPEPKGPTCWMEVVDLTTLEGLPPALRDVDRAKFVVWATAKKIPFSAEGAASVTLEAYLLNCALDEVDQKKAEFRFEEIIPGVVPSIKGDYNGTVKILGATTLEKGGDWAEGKVDARFYKAVLVK